MNWSDIKLAFWHPFGPYCRQSPEAILRWKAREAETTKLTFWSFAYAPTAGTWLEILERHHGPVYVLCSHSPNARDPCPDAEEMRATHYRFLSGPDAWQPILTGNDEPFVTNDFKRGGLATAFSIRRVSVIDPPVIPDIPILWYARGTETWSERPLPTRGEYLVQRGGSGKLRAVSAVLECAPPFLATLRGPTNVLPNKAFESGR